MIHIDLNSIHQSNQKKENFIFLLFRSSQDKWQQRQQQQQPLSSAYLISNMNGSGCFVTIRYATTLKNEGSLRIVVDTTTGMDCRSITLKNAPKKRQMIWVVVVVFFLVCGCWMIPCMALSNKYLQ